MSILSVASMFLKQSSSFIEFEERLIPAIAELVCTQVSLAIERYDDTLCFGHQDWQILRKDTRSIQCLFGTLVFKRRLVKDGAGRVSHPLDQALGLPRARRYSPLLMARVAQLASRAVLRTVALAVDAFTPGSISAPTVDKIMHETGQDLNEVEQVQAVAPAATEAPKRCVPQLFIEGDAFEVKLKHGQRVMVNRLQLSEGVETVGKRRVLINRHVVSGISHEAVFNEMARYLKAHYDRRHVALISGSDNGSGYAPDDFSVFARRGQSHVHVLDVYHLNRKLKERFSTMPVGLKEKLRKAVFSGDQTGVNAVLDTADALATSDAYSAQTVENLGKLRGYLARNWSNIVPLVSLDWHQTGLGSCESNHRAYTYRLKKQGRSWTKNGLVAILRIIDAGQNGTLAQSLSETALFDTAMPAEREASVEIPRDFKMVALFKQSNRAHSGARPGKIDAQGVTGTSFGRMAKQLNDLNLNTAM